MRDEHSEPPEIIAILEAAKRIALRRNKSFKIDQTRMEEFKGFLSRENISDQCKSDFVGPVQATLDT